MSTNTKGVEERQFVLDGSLKESNIIQKSRPLAEIYQSELTFQELKILDVYLSRINSHNPSQRTVAFGKGELENIFGLERIRTPLLKTYLTNLMTTAVQIDNVEANDKSDERFTIITLFSKASCKRVNGLWTVELTCSDEAMKYIFDIDHIGYLKYQLRNVARMKSKYSYAMYMWLMSHRDFRKGAPDKVFVVSVEELKEKLNCGEVCYSAFKEFNRNVLKLSHREINEKTDLRYDYKSIRHGQFVAEIEFTIYAINGELPSDYPFSGELSEYVEPVYEKEEISEAEIMIKQFEEGMEKEKKKYVNLLSHACNNEFTKAQLELIYEMLITPEYCRSEDIVGYFRELFLKLNVISEKQHIHNRFSYITAMIKDGNKEI